MYFLEGSLCSLDWREFPKLLSPYGRIDWKLKFNFADAIFPHLRMGKGFNRNLTRNSVAYAKAPSVFPNFSKFFLISQNPRNSEKCRVASFFEARILEEKKLR